MQISNTPYPFIDSEYVKIANGLWNSRKHDSNEEEKNPKDETDLRERSCVVCSPKDPPSGWD